MKFQSQAKHTSLSPVLNSLTAEKSKLPSTPLPSPLMAVQSISRHLRRTESVVFEGRAGKDDCTELELVAPRFSLSLPLSLSRSFSFSFSFSCSLSFSLSLVLSFSLLFSDDLGSSLTCPSFPLAEPTVTIVGTIKN